ncbi:S8 family peptidase [Actinoalloteichus caeruleus]|uniref:S8 family peptidase n=1 Tax=Actinoalloteichus cyanogriseus TaxID=2893586 RepID=UPI003AADE219
MRPRRLTAAGGAVLMGLSLALTVPSATAAEQSNRDAPLTSSASGRAEVLTLVTGDRLHVHREAGDALGVRVEPAEGREHVTFVRYADGDRLVVIPSDALGLVRSGLLDERLFDVRGLLEQGFADSGPLPLIVSYAEGSDPGARASVLSEEASTGRVLESLNAVAVHPDEDSGDGVWSEITQDDAEARVFSGGVERVWLNGRAQPLDEESNAQVGAPEAWESGYTGEGVTIAVLDSGYDPEHPDFEGAVTEAVNFVDPEGAALDEDGHGTHVAGTVAGRGTASDGAHRGVAPDADLLVGKVCGPFDCPEDAIIAGMEWAAASDAVAVNMSLGGGPTDGTDPMSLAVNTLTEATDTLFVIAAGNFGADESVSSPAAADAALAVGSVTKSDELSGFSSRGPRVRDRAVKPEIAAPGSAIVSARAAGTSMGSPVDEHHTSADGTSMAAPHVAGAVALLAQANPDWTSSELRAALMASAQPLEGIGVAGQGAGRLDVARAVNQTVVSEPAAVSLGNFLWPQDDLEPVVETVTYRNSGDEDVTLDLAFDVVGSEGEPAPDGLVELSTSEVTVPAGGTAEVEITVDPTVNETTGYLSGQLLATAGEVSVSTPAGVFVEEESYALDLTVLDRDGGTPEWALLVAENVETGEDTQILPDENGDYVGRLTKGTYNLLGIIPTPTGGEGDEVMSEDQTFVTQAGIDVTSGDAQGTLDAAPGVPVRAETERTTELTSWDGSLVSGQRLFGLGVVGDATSSLYAVPDEGSFTLAYRPVLASSSEEDYTYHLAFELVDEIPEEILFAPSDEELAEVAATYHGQGVEATGTRAVTARFDYDILYMLLSKEVEVPSTETLYYSVGDNLSYTEIFDLSDPDAGIYEYWDRTSTYETGSSESSWNLAPLTVSGLAQRVGDEAMIGSSLFTTSDADLYEPYSASGDGVVGQLTLSHEGEVIASSEDVAYLLATLPSGPAEFTVEANAVRDVPWSTLGSSAEARWTFHSDTAGETEVEEQPMLGVRFSGATGDADLLGRLPGGGEHVLTVDVERAVGEVTELSVEVSTDDGETWEAVEVVDGTVTVEHPEEGFVSLRASATDSAGNSVEQTVIRSYQVISE